ncbi:MAG: hypothetical protein FJW39_02360 [Acidobacteria bacterium]|nr:hypothetical protein [Acidobacteriota bacterium]
MASRKPDSWIRSLRVINTGPFDDITVKFDRHVNVFTGPNNSGKTVLLSVLASQLVPGFKLPGKFQREGTRWVVNGSVPADAAMYVPALRFATGFRASAPGRPSEKQTDLPYTESSDHLLQTMVNLDYKAYREQSQEIREINATIGALVSEITVGYPVEFAGIGEDSGGFSPRFRTIDGVFPLDSLSQGTQSLLHACARIVIEARQPGVLIIDEIDAHLHPAWQRRVIPALRKFFPGLQLFCGTHSPLVVNGLNKGQIHLLRRDAQGKVVASVNSADLTGWSCDDVYSILFDVEPVDQQTAEELASLKDLIAMGAPVDASQTLKEQITRKMGPANDAHAQLLADQLLLEAARRKSAGGKR